MKKQNVMNLVKYHVEGNEAAFKNEVVSLAKEFDSLGDYKLAMYLMNLISDSDVIMTQELSAFNYKFLKKINVKRSRLQLPEDISDDLIGIINAINKNQDIGKFIFYGHPGTGKTASVSAVASALKREILSVDFPSLVDSKLGETAKNVVSLFNEIKSSPYRNIVFLLDEIDSLVFNRVDSQDIREMSRVISTFMRELDNLPDDVIIIATTNLYERLDPAIKRRFDAAIDFNRYTKEDLIDVAVGYLKQYMEKDVYLNTNIKLFTKIFKYCENIPMPGEISHIIKTSVCFSSDNENDYLKRIFKHLYPKIDLKDVNTIVSLGFSYREAEILSSISKSSIARRVKL